MSRLSLRERMWGGRLTDPPIKAGAERRKKAVFQALLSHSFMSLTPALKSGSERCAPQLSCAAADHAQPR
ncbi:MAG: hypothetical protein PsegKO_36110 [Pseudohongiellaceae bacterium]